MPKIDPQTFSPRRLLAAPIFYLVSLLLLPVTIVGYGLWIVKSFLAGPRGREASSAQGPLSARWFEHVLGTRSDEPAYRMMLALPGVSPLGLRLVGGTMRLAHRLSGFTPRAFRYPVEGQVPVQYQASARQAFFDQVVEQYAAGQADSQSDSQAASRPQLVILGAGFDTRAFRLPIQAGSPAQAQVHAFELDDPRTQAVKRDLLEKAGVDPQRVAFVPASYTQPIELQPDWLERLAAAGFDPHQPALFVWEGLMMYLDRPAVEAVLRQVAGAAPGSLLAFDFFTTEFLTSQAPYMRYARAAAEAVGEPFRFGIDSTPPVRKRLAEFLGASGLKLGELRLLGKDKPGQPAWGGFATAIVK